MKKGVYVENLKEYEVITVKDVVKLLLQVASLNFWTTVVLKEVFLIGETYLTIALWAYS